MASLWLHLMCAMYEKSDNKKYLIQKQDKFIVSKNDTWCDFISSTIGGKKVLICFTGWTNLSGYCVEAVL